MPGVPTVHRCQRCKTRKIKCDEKWPTCSHCLRAKVPCSGPPAWPKFVPYNCSPSEDELLPFRAPAPSLGRMVLSDVKRPPITGIKSYDHHHGGVFGRQRLAYERLGRNPTTVANRVASRLVGFLGHQDAPWNFLTAVGYMQFIPARLGESAALRDCVALACSTWSNFRRNLPLEQVIDLKDYGKAIRSLRQALDNPKHVTSELLAAVTVLERIEAIFDSGRPRFRTLHVSGIQGIMIKRGPPKLDDELGVQLALENHATLLSLWLAEGGDNFYLRSPWKEFMEELSRTNAILTSPKRDGYVIGKFFGYWPELVHKFQQLNADDNAFSREVQIEDLRCHVARIQDQVGCVGEDITQRARSEGRVTERPDKDTPFGRRFEFRNMESFTSYTSYLLIRTIFNRMLCQLDLLQGQINMPLEVEYKEICRQIWMCIPLVRSLGFAGGIVFLAPLYVSYEGGDRAEKDYVLSYIGQVVDYKGILPKDRKALENYVLNAARAWTGRSPLEVVSQ